MARKLLVEREQPVTSDVTGLVAVGGGEELQEGDEVTVGWGVEKYAPIRYQSFDLGPFSIKTKVRAGETGQDAFGRAQAMLKQFSTQAFEEQLRLHLERVKRAAKLTGELAGQPVKEEG